MGAIGVLGTSSSGSGFGNETGGGSLGGPGKFPPGSLDASSCSDAARRSYDKTYRTGGTGEAFLGLIYVSGFGSRLVAFPVFFVLARFPFPGLVTRFNNISFPLPSSFVVLVSSILLNPGQSVLSQDWIIFTPEAVLVA